MTSYALLIIALLAYTAASLMIMRRIQATTGSNPGSGELPRANGVAFVGAVSHAIYTCLRHYDNGALDFSLSGTINIVSVIVVLIFLAAGLKMPIRRLGIMVFPLNVACILFATLWASEPQYLNNRGLAYDAHILVSIAAYSLITIAAIQALLYIYQDRQIKNRTNPAMLKALPPLQTMEQLLFRLVGTGFILLTLTLLSGAIFSQQIFAQAFEFKHHTILALLGWAVFALMLFKRVQSGLRGSQAVAWTIAGFVLIQLGYFGTKLVTESLNIQ